MDAREAAVGALLEHARARYAGAKAEGLIDPVVILIEGRSSGPGGTPWGVDHAERAEAAGMVVPPHRAADARDEEIVRRVRETPPPGRFTVLIFGFDGASVHRCVAPDSTKPRPES